MKKLLAFLAFVAVLGFAGYSFNSVSRANGEGGPDPATLFPARRGDLTIVVTENGYLKAKKSVKMKPEPNSGRLRVTAPCTARPATSPKT